MNICGLDSRLVYLVCSGLKAILAYFTFMTNSFVTLYDVMVDENVYCYMLRINQILILEAYVIVYIQNLLMDMLDHDKQMCTA